MPWVFSSLSAQAHLSPSFLLFNKHFPSTYYEPRTVLGAGESAWIRQIWPLISYIQIEKTDNKCICKLTRCFQRVINVPKGRHREMEYRENMGKERETTLGRAVRHLWGGDTEQSLNEEKEWAHTFPTTNGFWLSSSENLHFQGLADYKYFFWEAM